MGTKCKQYLDLFCVTKTTETPETGHLFAHLINGNRKHSKLVTNLNRARSINWITKWTIKQVTYFVLFHLKN